jgi:integrase
MVDVREAIRLGYFDRARFFGAAPGTTGATFRDRAQAWLDTVVAAPSTRSDYRKHIARWIAIFGDRQLRSLVHSDIATVIADLRETASAKTVNNMLIPLRGVFRVAILDKAIRREDDPLAEIKNLKHQSPEVDPFDASEMALIVAYLHEHAPAQVANYWEFAFRTGLRTSELIALRWGRVDWNRKAVKVDLARVVGEEKGTKTERVRTVHLTDEAMAVLQRQKPHTFLKGPDNVVFENPVQHQGWNDDRYQRDLYFYPALKALGIRKRNAYNTRHTFATIALMGGVNPSYISRQLGHANTGMLFKHYAKWIDGAADDREREKMKTAFAPSVPGVSPEQRRDA